MKGSALQGPTQIRPMTAARASERERSPATRVYWQQWSVAANKMRLPCLVLTAPALCQT